MSSDSRVFPCNTCSETFQTSDLQRSHMRQPWHINNLRRRVAKLPALFEEQYEKQSKSQETIPQQTDNSEQEQQRPFSHNAETDDSPFGELSPKLELECSEETPPTRCLFCNLHSLTLDANIDHMSSVHGLFIPSPDHVLDMESFLGYLATIVFEYKECLYCGLEKSTMNGVQTHMRDKGHCMIMMTAESELLDFWDLSDSGDEDEDDDVKRTKSAAIKLSGTEMRLPSGTVISSRSDVTQLRTRPGLAQSRAKSLQHRSKKAETRAITTGENQVPDDAAPRQALPAKDRRVAVCGELGLAGLLESQRLALQITEKKMKRREAIAKAAYRHAMEREPVKTKYYKTEAPIYQAG